MTILYFDDVASAQLYRAHIGGGLIFEATNGTAGLYPTGWTAGDVITHATGAGVKGQLIS